MKRMIDGGWIPVKEIRALSSDPLVHNLLFFIIEEAIYSPDSPFLSLMSGEYASSIDKRKRVARAVTDDSS